MSFTQRRNVSFQTIKSFFRSTKPTPSTELQKPLTSLPNATGSGAFVEPISYQVLGSSSNLLNIKLPRSSILNIRYSNSKQKIIAMNGHINSLYTELAKSNENNLIFQRCFNQNEPMSLLISMNAQNSNFAVINNNNNSKWIVKRSSLFSWSGPSIKPKTTDSNQNLVQMEGEGAFVVASPGQILQLNLKVNESLQVNSKSIIGYTTNDSITDSIEKLNNSVRSVVDVSVARAPPSIRFNWIKKYSEKYITLPKLNLSDDPTVKQIFKSIGLFTSKIKAIINYFKAKLINSKKSGYFIEIQGPKTIFLTNAVNIDDRILTEKELEKLLT